MKTFKRGLVVGKFSPLHNGHRLLIERALDECEELLIFSYSNPEFKGCEADKRRGWLKRLFPSAIGYVIDNASLSSFPEASKTFKSVPGNEAPADEHRLFVFLLYLSCATGPLDAIFTSEDYGEPFTAFMSKALISAGLQTREVKHIEVDKARLKVPVSGTLVRESVHEARNLLPPGVYRDFVTRVLLLGAESTGKSVLAEKLAKKYNTRFVPEYGRTLYELKQGKLEFHDMLAIAGEHIRQEEEALLKANRFLFIDTSPLTTYFYSQKLFGKADSTLTHLAERKYDLTFLCHTDCPFIWDDTRQDETFRDMQHQWYLEALSAKKINYHLLSGRFEEREAMAESMLR